MTEQTPLEPPPEPPRGPLRHYDPLASRTSRRMAAARIREQLDPANPEYSVQNSASGGWTIFSYLVAGMLAYGFIGWLIGHFTHLAFLFPIGMAVGLALGILAVVLRYGRS